MKLVIKCLIFVFLMQESYSLSPYQLSWDRDGYLLGSGISAGIAALIIDSQVNKITQEEINNLSADNINGFDKLWYSNLNKNLSITSDILLLTTAAIPAYFLFDSGTRNDALTIATMYFETMLLTAAIPYITKGTFQRFRPYLYNGNLDIATKEETEGRRSFFSGHTSTAFASAVFFSQVYSDYFPNSEYTPYIWGSSLLIATSIGILRIEAGKHFLTDVITGAVFGSVVGYLVPQLHKIKNKDVSINITPFNIGFSISY